MGKRKTPDTDRPHENWTLDRLGQYAQAIARRTAQDAWRLGRAYGIAKRRVKAEGKRIESWRREWVPFISQPTLSRYEAVAALPEAEVQGRGLTAVYRLLGLVPAKVDRSQGVGSLRGAAPPADRPYTTPPQLDPPDEPESLVRRLTVVLSLLHSICTDLPCLDLTADPAPVLEEVHKLMDQIRAAAESGVAA